MPGMQSDYNIRELTDKHDAAFENIESLFYEMYACMRKQGLILELADDGARKWIDGIRTGLGRFGSLFVCENEGKIIGFAHGSIILTPNYFGSKKIGVITHVHVQDRHRKMGAGRALVKALEKWFDGKEVFGIELQVLSGNIPAIKFWEKLGYQDELRQYRKLK